METEHAAKEAVTRWLRAVNPPVEQGLVEAAVSEDCYVTRHHWAHADEYAKVMERFDGPARVLVWLQRTPPSLRFSLDGELRLDGGIWVQPYLVEVEGEEFRGGGVWRFELDGDGRIRVLQHRPKPLPDEPPAL